MSKTPATRSERQFRAAVTFLVIAVIALVLVLLYKTPVGQQTTKPSMTTNLQNG